MAHQAARTESRSDLALIFQVGVLGNRADAELLAIFEDGPPRASEAAFSALVARHGPLVWSTCRAILGDPDRAADAFQATFVILARKAGRIRVEETLGRWLYGTARRVAGKARARHVAERARLAPLEAAGDPESSTIPLSRPSVPSDSG